VTPPRHRGTWAGPANLLTVPSVDHVPV